MHHHRERTSGLDILLVLSGAALLYLGVTDYLQEPALESAAIAGLGALELVEAGHRRFAASGEKGQQAIGTAATVLMMLWFLPDLVRGMRTDGVALWILGVTFGVIVLIAATAGLHEIRRRTADQAARSSGSRR